MSVTGKHDDLLLEVLKEEGQVLPFLNVIFGFLYRRTDFYLVQENPAAKVGFPPGVSEQLVRDSFRKWQKLSLPNNVSTMENEMTDLVIREEEVVTTDDLPDMPVQPTYEQHQPIAENKIREDDLCSDTYNGTDCGKYRWSQTALEVDIKVPVSSNVMKSKDVKVDIQACKLCVNTRDCDNQWCTLVEGQLTHRHLKDESIWTLLPGRQITIHLQKLEEKWWDSLLTTENKLDLSKVDMSRHVTDLPEEDQAQVQKLMVDEDRKRLGLLPTEHQGQLDVLKKAWNLDGSPFQGTPFDPSILQLPPS